MEMSSKIREIRKLKGFSQNDIAENLGISQRAYSKIELNETQLNWKKINQIAAILDIGVWELVDNKLEYSDKENVGVQSIGLLQQLIDKYENKIETLKQEIADLKQNTL